MGEVEECDTRSISGIRKGWVWNLASTPVKKFALAWKEGARIDLERMKTEVGEKLKGEAKWIRELEMARK